MQNKVIGDQLPLSCQMMKQFMGHVEGRKIENIVPACKETDIL